MCLLDSISSTSVVIRSNNVLIVFMAPNYWEYTSPTNMILYSSWWLTYPPEKYDFVSWGYYSQYIMESHKIHVPNHQPVMVIWLGMMIKPLEWLSYGYKKCSKPPTSIGFYRYGSIAIWENTPLSDFKLPSHRIWSVQWWYWECIR